VRRERSWSEKERLLNVRCGGSDVIMKPVMHVVKEETCSVVIVALQLFICSAGKKTDFSC